MYDTHCPRCGQSPFNSGHVCHLPGEHRSPFSPHPVGAGDGNTLVVSAPMYEARIAALEADLAQARAAVDSACRRMFEAQTDRLSFEVRMAGALKERDEARAEREQAIAEVECLWVAIQSHCSAATIKAIESELESE